MRIAILTWYDDNAERYGHNCWSINKIYCEKHNYTLIKSSKKVYKDRSAHWERFPLMLTFIENYDYIMWVDADAFFYIDSPPLEPLIKEYNKDIIFSEDCGKTEDNPPYINSGIIILKNTERVINIIKKWAYSKELMIKYSKIDIDFWIEDQALIRGFYKDDIDNIQDISIIAPYLKLQHFFKEDVGVDDPKPYIYHLAGRDFETRVNETQEYIKKSILSP